MRSAKVAGFALLLFALTGLAACGGNSSSSPNKPTQSVLLAGGLGPNNASTELYEVATNSFAHSGQTATLNADCAVPTATLLNNGRLLIAGGYDPSSPILNSILNSTDLYDPTADTFASVAETATMNVARRFDTATLLSNDKVLMAGGEGDNGVFMASTELYDPTNNTFTFAA